MIKDEAVGSLSLFVCVWIIHGQEKLRTKKMIQKLNFTVGSKYFVFRTEKWTFWLAACCIVLNKVYLYCIM